MINLKQEYLEELKNIFTHYCPKAEVWAYGSRVKNNSHSGSDLDLVVKNFNDENKNIRELKELINNSNLPFLVDLQQFDNLPISFQNEIEKKYVKIWNKEENNDL